LLEALHYARGVCVCARVRARERERERCSLAALPCAGDHAPTNIETAEKSVLEKMPQEVI
jgi:hypothetical protein